MKIDYARVFQKHKMLKDKLKDWNKIGVGIYIDVAFGNDFNGSNYIVMKSKLKR